MAQTPSPFDAEIAAFEKADAKSAPPQNAILFVGSSSIRMWTSVAQDLPDYQVINRGFGGSQATDVVQFMDRIVLPYRPRIIVFFVGTNDLAAGKSPEQVYASYEEFVKRVQTALPDTRIACISQHLAPVRANLRSKFEQLNRYYKDAIHKFARVDYIDTYKLLLLPNGEPNTSLFIADRLHMNKDGYKIWTKLVHRYLVKHDGVGDGARPTRFDMWK